MLQISINQQIEQAFIQKHILSNGHNGWRLPDLCKALNITFREIKPVINEMLKAKKLRVSKSMKSDLYYLIVGFSNPEMFKEEIQKFRPNE
jgi:hypothetical protein